MFEYHWNSSVFIFFSDQSYFLIKTQSDFTTEDFEMIRDGFQDSFASTVLL